MDANKREQLLAIDYVIRDCCAFCEHGRFMGEEFGTCMRFQYQHEKHTAKTRQLSVHRAGVCPEFTDKTGLPREAEDWRLHGFIDFREA